MGFVRASKKRGKLRLGLIGPAGAGKSYSALAIATAIAETEGGRVAVVDSEHGSASLYGSGKPFDFDVMELSDFSPERYTEAIHEAERAGYSVVVLDSLSHAWMGKGGALEMKDNASRRQGENSYTAWRHVTPLHNGLIDAMLQSRLHVIATMRSKTEFVIEKDEKGKNTVRKVGMAPIQREGMEFEFTLVGDLDQDNVLTISKTRCGSAVPPGQTIRKPGRELAQTLLAWLSDGEEAAPAPAAAETKAASATVAAAKPETISAAVAPAPAEDDTLAPGTTRRR